MKHHASKAIMQDRGCVRASLRFHLWGKRLTLTMDYHETYPGAQWLPVGMHSEMGSGVGKKLCSKRAYSSLRK